jgi:shikimate kinase
MLKTFSSSRDNFVLSCGGGTPCFNNNMDLINSSGISIYINLTAKSLTDWLLNSTTNRPLIKNTPRERLFERVTELLEIREYYYNQAQIIIDGINLKPEDIIARIPKLKD